MVGISGLAKTIVKGPGEGSGGRVSRVGVQVPQRVAKKIIERTFAEIVKQINEGKSVRIAGFGIFSRKITKARNAKSPKTKQIIKVPAKNKVHFSASSKIKYK